MKKQKGFSIVILLVVIAALSVIAASGYMVYTTQQKNDSSESTTTGTNEAISPKTVDIKDETVKTNYTIRYINPNNTEKGIVLYSVADLSKLPADFPAGATELMKKDIGVQLYPGNPEQCTLAYSIVKYNDVNVGGGRYTVDASKEACPGGAMAVMSIGDNGAWQVNGFQDGPSCTLIEEAQIYKEFITQCYSATSTDGSSNQEDIIDNPNGNSANL